MARTASAWGWYAEMNDDVRHQLIDRAWFQQYQRDPAFERDVAAAQAEADALYGPAPEAGLDPEFDETPAIEPFYGEPRGDEPDAASLYSGPTPSLDGPEQMEPEP